jgi:hypothetical protein
MFPNPSSDKISEVWLFATDNKNQEFLSIRL